MRGWLIVNAYVKSDKFREIFDMLVEAGKRQGCVVTIKTNEEMWRMLAESDYNLRAEGKIVDFVLFWDKDIKLARALEGQGLRLFNSASSIAVCDDKAETQIALLNKEVRMPRTFFSPKVFNVSGCPYVDYYLEIAESIGYPCIVKECFGSFGQQVYLAHDERELRERIHSIFPRNFIVQEYISTSEGRDIRVHVVGNKVVAAMCRYNPADFRANITNGGKMKPYTVNRGEERMALAVCRELGLDFGGIDILFGEDDEPVFCEANSNAHFKNLYDCTGINVADEIISYIKEEQRR